MCVISYLKKSICVNRLPCGKTYVFATWKRKRGKAKLTMPGKRTNWHINWQEAGVPASVSTHPVYSGEENPATLLQDSVIYAHSAHAHTHSCLPGHTQHISIHTNTYTHSHTTPLFFLLDCEVAKSPCPRLSLPQPHRQSPAMPACLVHYSSVCCIRNPQYQPESFANPPATLPTMPSCL